MLCGCYGYHTVVPAHNIPAGTVIQESDLSSRVGRIWTMFPVDFATDRSHLVGHRALKLIKGGSYIHETDIAP